ncbi:MAG: hypothetical protein ABI588_07780 [Arenimonas sp.]
MFYVKHTDGECDPVLRCHVCATTIIDAINAWVVYPRVLQEGEAVRAVFVHRESCLPKAMKLLDSAHGAPHSICLEVFLERLRTGSTVAC